MPCTAIREVSRTEQLQPSPPHATTLIPLDIHTATTTATQQQHRITTTTFLPVYHPLGLGLLPAVFLSCIRACQPSFLPAICSHHYICFSFSWVQLDVGALFFSFSLSLLLLLPIDDPFPSPIWNARSFGSYFRFGTQDTLLAGYLTKEMGVLWEQKDEERLWIYTQIRITYPGGSTMERKVWKKGKRQQTKRWTWISLRSWDIFFGFHFLCWLPYFTGRWLRITG